MLLCTIALKKCWQFQNENHSNLQICWCENGLNSFTLWIWPLHSCEYFKIDSENVIVFHDDLDVDFTKIKTKFGGSSAGHNGIASIDKFIGKEYSRVRIGIGKPDTKIEISDFVLTNFSDEEKIKLEKVIKNIIESMPILIDKKLDLFSSTVNNQ